MEGNACWVFRAVRVEGRRGRGNVDSWLVPYDWSKNNPKKETSYGTIWISLRALGVAMFQEAAEVRHLVKIIQLR